MSCACVCEWCGALTMEDNTATCAIFFFIIYLFHSITFFLYIFHSIHATFSNFISQSNVCNFFFLLLLPESFIHTSIPKLMKFLTKTRQCYIFFFITNSQLLQSFKFSIFFYKIKFKTKYQSVIFVVLMRFQHYIRLMCISQTLRETH